MYMLTLAEWSYYISILFIVASTLVLFDSRLMLVVQFLFLFKAHALCHGCISICFSVRSDVEPFSIVFRYLSPIIYHCIPSS